MKPYLDDVGKWTVGVGHLIGKGSLKDKEQFEKERKAAGLTPSLSRKEALELFMKDVSTRVPAVQAKFKKQWPMISDNLKAALIDIKFRGDLDNTSGGDFTWVKLIRAGEYKKAAQAYLNHKEYKARMQKKGSRGDGVVLRMNRNSKIIAAEPGGKLSPKTNQLVKIPNKLTKVKA
jgi:GH24 family phage-related lysozyme (muramidase)